MMSQKYYSLLLFVLVLLLMGCQRVENIEKKTSDVESFFNGVFGAGEASHRREEEQTMREKIKAEQQQRLNSYSPNNQVF
jgi:hypothetical protein